MARLHVLFLFSISFSLLEKGAESRKVGSSVHIDYKPREFSMEGWKKREGGYRGAFVQYFYLLCQRVWI